MLNDLDAMGGFASLRIRAGRSSRRPDKVRRPRLAGNYSRPPPVFLRDGEVHLRLNAKLKTELDFWLGKDFLVGKVTMK
jgi:hypothetical protein